MDKVYYHQHPQGRTAVLLVNLGTPDAPTPWAVMRYLREFLSDSRVVELPPWLWLPLLYGVILPIRSPATARKYQSIWTEQGSPLRVETERLAAALELPDDVVVAYAMRYGNPSIASVMNQLREQSVRRLVVVPLYPQYAASTTATAVDAVAAALRSWRFVPELHTLQGYADHPLYIEALKDQVLTYWQTHGQPDHWVISFHGLPKRCLAQGDPYACLCQKTARLLSEAVGMKAEVAFQSRFGREPWLEPYLDDTLLALAQSGGRVDVICPGFSVDCLETLDEVASEYRERYCQAGGRELRYIPALNHSPAHAALVRALVEPYLPQVDQSSSDHGDDTA